MKGWALVANQHIEHDAGRDGRSWELHPESRAVHAVRREQEVEALKVKQREMLAVAAYVAEQLEGQSSNRNGVAAPHGAKAR